MELAVCATCDGEGCASCRDDGAILRQDSAGCPSVHHVARSRFAPGSPAPDATHGPRAPRGPHVLLRTAGGAWCTVQASWMCGNNVVLSEFYARGVAVGMSQLRPRPHLLLVVNGRVVHEWPAIDRAPDRPGRACIHPHHEPPAIASWRLTVSAQLHLMDKEYAGKRQDAEALAAVEDLLVELANYRSRYAGGEAG